ncbi:MAG: precorrin-6y C5,15-methyltransferase (decarboxylating) subunit CbiE [Nitrospirota bacterium]|nr:precorrin-6y C5,15-methyltransferase (decarboxylating) subunit CbiE [Nitrospirota bacterium]
MPKAGRLILVGIGYRPLSEKAIETVGGAGVLLTSSRLLDVFKRYAEYEAVKDRIKVIDKVPETIAFIRDKLSAGNNEPGAVVLLASGDPFFFGIGRRMIEEFGSDRVEVLPDLSSMQVAFSRVNLPWDDAFCISVHGGPDIAKRRKLPYEVDDIPRLLERFGKLAVLTDKQNNPSQIARVLHSSLRTSHSALLMHVCEKLGYPEERVWSGTVEQAVAMQFADPNVVILQRQETSDKGQKTGNARFGLKEQELSHSRGLITKDEVRAVSIHKLRLPEQGVLWDIGAGSGSVSIEAARMVPGLKVIAVERDDEQIGHLKANRASCGIRNYDIVRGTAPDALSGLAAPDRVFIGGSGGNLSDIVRYIQEKMTSGIIVINAATLETLQEALASLEACGYSAEVSEISVSRSKPVAGKRLMSALNPIYIVTGVKG